MRDDGVVARIAFVGVGAMGGRMARRLLDAGHDVMAWNRSREKLRDLEEAGADTADSPAAAASEAEAVITMVADPDALHEVTDGDAGIASGIRADATWIEMSTVGPAAIARLSSSIEAGLLDAPVLGSLSEAEEGRLQVFVGGPKDLAERWMPVLSAFGRPIHVGPLGAGASAKLMANSTLFGSLCVLGEALAVGEGLGLDREVIFEVLSSTPIAPQAERRRDAIETGQFPLRFSLSLASKDAALVVEAAEDAGLDVRLARAARSWLEDAEERGLGDRDYSAILAHILGAS